jgi:hypothetical protein
MFPNNNDNRCLDCDVELTKENTYPSSSNRKWRRCKECTARRRQGHTKLCLWCGTLLTEENTHKGGPSQHSYCKSHYTSTGRLKDFDSRIPIEQARPNIYSKIRYCANCGILLTKENRARTKTIKPCVDCYLEEQAQATVYCLHCNVLLTEDNRDPTASRLYPYCKLHLTYKQRQQAQAGSQA